MHMCIFMYMYVCVYLHDYKEQISKKQIYEMDEMKERDRMVE